MKQTRLSSLIEAVINVMIGFGINFTANALIFPLFGWDLSVQANITLGIIYTGISIIRSYTIRRYFNRKIHLLSMSLSGEKSAPVTSKSKANTHQTGGAHYKNRTIQPWDFIAANKIGYFEGNVIKYLTRWKTKNGIEDLKKAQHYIEKLIEVTESNKEKAK